MMKRILGSNVQVPETEGERAVEGPEVHVRARCYTFRLCCCIIFPEEELLCGWGLKED
jgi:hypothetical protein